jgi:hypothetical protein
MKFFKSIRRPLRGYSNRARNWILEHRCKHIVDQLSDILSKKPDEVPVIVVSYNNGIYVRNIVSQLNQFEITPIIIDNNSSSGKTTEILNQLENSDMAYIVRSRKNHGHMVGFLKPVYDLLPETFCYTDPDLQLNEKLPKDFITTLAQLTLEFPVFKAGFALSLHGHGPLKDIKFHSCHRQPIYYEKHLSIEEFEARYWINRLKHDELELYAAPIDTTFSLYRKSNYRGDFHNAIRVAGDYSAIHLPWFKDLDFMSEEDRTAYESRNVSSNWI